MTRLKVEPSELARDGHNVMLKILKAWKPERIDHEGWKPKTEHEWSESLFAHLQNVTDAVIVNKEKGSGRGREDLTLDYKYHFGKYHHAIELKRGMNSVPKMRDLTGQITSYFKAQASYVHAVICGDEDEVDERLLRQLKEEHSGFWTKNPSIFWKKPDGGLHVILNPPV